MGSLLRIDEKNGKIIRSLLKQSPNRRCINCNSSGPQYVCLDFWTFVCTICSGIHREFTHRVKSVSMSNFTSEEITALQSGGNEQARAIYFKEWDFQRQLLPDSSNEERLRDLIRNVYVHNRFFGKRQLNREKEGPWSGSDSVDSDSGSLIDFDAKPDTSAVNGQSDPFEHLSATRLTAITSNNSDWITFDMVSMVPLEVPVSGVSSAYNDPLEHIDGRDQGAGQCTPLQLVPAPPAFGSIRDDLFSQASASEQHYSMEGSKPWNPFHTSTASHSVKHHATMQLDTCNTQALPSLASSTDGSQVFHASLGSERSSPTLALQASRASYMVPQFVEIGGTSIYGQVPGYSKPPKSKNPFDLPEDHPPSIPIKTEGKDLLSR